MKKVEDLEARALPDADDLPSMSLPLSPELRQLREHMARVNKTRLELAEAAKRFEERHGVKLGFRREDVTGRVLDRDLLNLPRRGPRGHR